MTIENLTWQLNYERKLSQEMNEMLENKVSALMADQNEDRKTITELQKSISQECEEHNRMDEL